MPPPPTPPGWYPDPLGGSGSRYWDGETWGSVVDTETVDTETSGHATGLSGNPRTALPTDPLLNPDQVKASPFYLPNLIAALIASICVVAGSVGPWIAFMGMTRNAIGMGRDGTITLILGIIATLALFALLNFGRAEVRSKHMVVLGTIAGIAGATAFVIALFSALEVSSREKEIMGRSLGPEIGWGLWMILIGAPVLAVTSLIVVQQVKGIAKTSGHGSGSPASPGRKALIPVLVGAAAVAALVGTVAVVNYSPPDPGASRCNEVPVPLTEIPTQTAQEPKLLIPTPQGWERSTKMDSEQIRFAIRNPGLTADGFTPNAVVTLQEVGPDVGSPEQLLEAQNDILTKKLGLPDITSVTTEVCGLPALRSSYVAPATKLRRGLPTIPPRFATTIGAVYKTGAANYIVTVTIQTTNPDSGTYQQDSANIIDGFQIDPPAGSR